MRHAWFVLVLFGCDGDVAPTRDMAAATCSQCGPTELCVQRYNGTCGGGEIECVTKTMECPQNACTTECQAAYCPSPYQCMNRAPCGTEATGAFTCYGP